MVACRISTLILSLKDDLCVFHEVHLLLRNKGNWRRMNERFDAHATIPKWV